MSDSAPIDSILANALSERTPLGAQGPTVDDAELMAWQRGELSTEREAALDALLADSPELRALALELTKSVPDALKTRILGTVPTQKHTRPLPIFFAAAAAAIVVAAGIWMLRPGPDFGPQYSVGALKGGVAAARGVETASGVFIPTSELVLDLTPENPREPPKVSIYVSIPSGPLKSAKASVTTVEEGGIRVRALAADLFGETFGPQRLHIVLGTADVSGQTAAQVQSNKSAQLLTVTVDYRSAR